MPTSSESLTTLGRDTDFPSRCAQFKPQAGAYKQIQLGVGRAGGSFSWKIHYDTEERNRFCLRDTNPNNLCEFPIDTWLCEWEVREEGERDGLVNTKDVIKPLVCKLIKKINFK